MPSSPSPLARAGGEGEGDVGNSRRSQAYLFPLEASISLQSWEARGALGKDEVQLEIP